MAFTRTVCCIRTNGLVAYSCGLCFCLRGGKGTYGGGSAGSSIMRAFPRTRARRGARAYRFVPESVGVDVPRRRDRGDVRLDGHLAPRHGAANMNGRRSDITLITCHRTGDA